MCWATSAGEVSSADGQRHICADLDVSDKSMCGLFFFPNAAFTISITSQLPQVKKTVAMSLYSVSKDYTVGFFHLYFTLSSCCCFIHYECILSYYIYNLFASTDLKNDNLERWTQLRWTRRHEHLPGFRSTVSRGWVQQWRQMREGNMRGASIINAVCRGAAQTLTSLQCALN